MVGEPCLNRCRLPIRQQGHDTPPLKVADNRCVTVIAPDSPVIDANDRQWLGARKCPPPHHAQHGIVADRKHQARGEARCRPATERQAEMMNHAIEPVCPAGTLGEYGSIEALGEYPPPATLGLA